MCFQAQQERIYNEYSIKRAKESRDKLETYYEQLVNKLQTEIKSTKIEITGTMYHEPKTLRTFFIGNSVDLAFSQRFYP